MQLTKMNLPNYRAAVCLNNYGTSLLERGRVQEAATLLRDSLAIMNTVLQATGAGSAGMRPQGVSVSDKLHFATKCMAELPMRARARRPSITPLVHVVRYDGEFASSVPPDECLSIHHQYNVIKIEDFDNHQKEDEDGVRAGLDIHTAIIVHNSAMTRLALSKLSNRKQRNTEMTQKVCVKLLRWAHAILSRAFDLCPRESTYLSVLVLGTLSTLLDRSGEQAEAGKVALARQSLKDMVQTFERLVPSQPGVAAAA